MMIDWLQTLDIDSPVDEDINSKHFQFMMYVVESYIKEQAGKVPDTDIKELLVFCNDYDRALSIVGNDEVISG